MALSYFKNSKVNKTEKLNKDNNQLIEEEDSDGSVNDSSSDEQQKTIVQN